MCIIYASHSKLQVYLACMLTVSEHTGLKNNKTVSEHGLKGPWGHLVVHRSFGTNLLQPGDPHSIAFIAGLVAAISDWGISLDKNDPVSNLPSANFW